MAGLWPLQQKEKCSIEETAPFRPFLLEIIYCYYLSLSNLFGKIDIFLHFILCKAVFIDF